MSSRSAPIKGHKLLHYGAEWRRLVAKIGPLTIYETIGGCECGAMPPNRPVGSKAAMRRWHRQHKDEIRAQMGADQ